MRKLTIQDFPVIGRDSTAQAFISSLGEKLLRCSSLGETINPVGHKLKTSHRSYQGMRWTFGCDKLVVINDKRQELAKMGERGLLTSSVILEESMQLNRGSQNYEHERNRFFVKDNEVANRRDLYTNLASLDLLWLMNEQELDAIEIETPSSPYPSSNVTYRSARYKDIVAKYIDHITDTAVTRINEQWKHYEQSMKKQDGGTIDWSKSFRYREWEECEWASEHRHSYSTIDMIIKRYNGYMFSDETTDDGVKVDKVDFDVWLTQTKVFGNGFRMEQQADMLLTHFGFATTSLLDKGEEDSCVSASDDGHFYADKHLIAESKFKRNDNWTCDLSNLVRAEAMKLNRLSQEGTFDE